MKRYIPRLVDDILRFKLRSSGTVWIRGPKWCGKSTTAEQFARTVIRMQDEGSKEQNIALAKMSPAEFLRGGSTGIDRRMAGHTVHMESDKDGGR